MQDPKMEDYFSTWNQREAAAETMIPLIGRLYRDCGVVITLYGRSLVHCSAIDILKAHRFARQIVQGELCVGTSLALLEAIDRLRPPSARIDLGKLNTRYRSTESSPSIDDFIGGELAVLVQQGNTMPPTPQDVVLYGFGRIGRILARLLIERSGGSDKWRLRAIVVKPSKKDDLAKRASLLRRDSVHGPFKGTIQIDEAEHALVVNGHMIRLLYADVPDQIDYTQYGIEEAVVLDNTGVWRDRQGLSRHLQAPGVEQVILTAPGEGDVPNIVYGVNNYDIDADERIFSAASCTTNAIAPVLKVLHKEFGVAHGHIETCHSYTNDQNLIDNFHSKGRRGRSAALNMVITETGAANAVGKILPHLEGRLTASAIRVPTPNVSLAILNLTLKRGVSVEAINEYLRQISLDSPLSGQIDFTRSPDVVSSDFIGTEKTGVVDAGATQVQDERCVLYVWYDNEYGYSGQVIRLLQHIAGLELPGLPGDIGEEVGEVKISSNGAPGSEMAINGNGVAVG
ncbi:MAG: glyceraldehyde-3-phosphate dehydrogenase [Candidatus Latescibacteria bacterium]|nr:glyceraldehyde-3-phosphate dehydrogenase [Candidatus Latescibacterota bacterium]